MRVQPMDEAWFNAHLPRAVPMLWEDLFSAAELSRIPEVAEPMGTLPETGRTYAVRPRLFRTLEKLRAEMLSEEEHGYPVFRVRCGPIHAWYPSEIAVEMGAPPDRFDGYCVQIYRWVKEKR